ncbi:MAG: polysaccharide deacetylase family protein, partial [Acidobacteriia bacterium]|nr:polysaccharide deacetylase family protein [Terriglobia bacterium]
MVRPGALSNGLRSLGLSRVPRPPRRGATFDDGPSEGTTEILDILARYRVPAAFFQCGANVERLPAVARAVQQAGHAIGNHSHTHPPFCFRSPRFMEQDVRRAQETIETHSGRRPDLFRAPFGVRWFG